MAHILVVAMRADNSPAMLLFEGQRTSARVRAWLRARRSGSSISIAPDLLIADVRLGGFNGLHLVIRSQSTRPNMRAILLDRVHDPVIALDADRHGAAYIGGTVTAATLAEHVSRLLNDTGPQRRWPRKQPIKGLVFQVARRRARVIDISYGGIRFELPPAESIPAQVPHGHSGIRRRLPRQAGVDAIHVARLDFVRRGAVRSESADGRPVATARGLDPRRGLIHS